MSTDITIIDRGRGPQLSTSRITVQDVVPYLQQKCSYEQIIEIMPVLTVAEIQVIERYVRDHYDEVMEQDRRIRERAARHQPTTEAEEARRERLEKARQMIRQKQQERNGDHPAG